VTFSAKVKLNKGGGGHLQCSNCQSCCL
jgi:hypothetical protein